MSVPPDYRTDRRPLLSGVADYESRLWHGPTLVAARYGAMSDAEIATAIAMHDRELARMAAEKRAKVEKEMTA